MNVMRKMIATILVASACWGLMSPEHILTSGTIQVVDGQTKEKVPFEVNAHFWNLLNAPDETIIIKSKLLERLLGE